MPLRFLSIFKKSKWKRSKRPVRHGYGTIAPRDSSPIAIPSTSSRAMTPLPPGSTAPKDAESMVSQKTILHRPRRGGLFPERDDETQKHPTRRRFRSSIYAQQSTSGISLRTSSSVYSQPPDRNRDAASTSGRSSSSGKASSARERAVTAKQIALFGAYTLRFKPASKDERTVVRRGILAAIRQRFAAFGRRCFSFGCSRGARRARAARLTPEASMPAKLTETSTRNDMAWTTTLRPGQTSTTPSDSCDMLVVDADARITAAAAVTWYEDCLGAHGEATPYVTVFEREREAERDRVRDTDEFLFGGGCNRCGSWNDRGFLLQR